MDRAADLSIDPPDAFRRARRGFDSTDENDASRGYINAREAVGGKPAKFSTPGEPRQDDLHSLRYVRARGAVD